MRKFRIFADSCSDLTTELRNKYDIDYFQMNIVYDGKELPADLDWKLYSPKELYDLVRAGTRITTNQVPAELFRKKFTECVEAGEDLLYISCSLALSGSVNTGTLIAREVMEAHPEAKIFCVDSLNSCMGEGLIALQAAELRAQGKTIEEVVDYVEKNRLKVNQFCVAETLEYLKRAGRVKASKAFFGNLFGVKPIIISDARGANFAVKKVKGRKGSILETVAMCKESIVEPENQILYVLHSDCEESEVNFFVEELKKEIPCKGVHVSTLGPIIGTSVGPGALVVYCVGKEVTVIGD